MPNGMRVFSDPDVTDLQGFRGQVGKQLPPWEQKKVEERTPSVVNQRTQAPQAFFRHSPATAS